MILKWNSPNDILVKESHDVFLIRTKKHHSHSWTPHTKYIDMKTKQAYTGPVVLEIARDSQGIDKRIIAWVPTKQQS